MIDKIKALGDAIPDHWTHLLIVLIGAGIALTHGPHAYETGTGLTAAGLAMYKGKSQ